MGNYATAPWLQRRIVFWLFYIAVKVGLPEPKITNKMKVIFLKVNISEGAVDYYKEHE